MFSSRRKTALASSVAMLFASGSAWALPQWPIRPIGPGKPVIAKPVFPPKPVGLKPLPIPKPPIGVIVHPPHPVGVPVGVIVHPPLPKPPVIGIIIHPPIGIKPPIGVKPPIGIPVKPPPPKPPVIGVIVHPPFPPHPVHPCPPLPPPMHCPPWICQWPTPVAPEPQEPLTRYTISCVAPEAARQDLAEVNLIADQWNSDDFALEGTLTFASQGTPQTFQAGAEGEISDDVRLSIQDGGGLQLQPAQDDQGNVYLNGSMRLPGTTYDNALQCAVQQLQ